MSGTANSLRAVLFALGANFSIFVAKGFAAWLTGSSAMLAEAVHSLADCANQGLLLLGMRQARKPPSEDHPLGYGKVLYFWSFLVAILLFSVGGMFSLYEGLHKLHATEPLSKPWIAVGVLAFGIVVEFISFRACLKEVNKVRAGRSLWRWFRESRNSDLLVIFGEDLAAMFGLMFALAAVLLTMLTGNPIFDAIGTLAIGALLIVVAMLVAIEVKALLVGQSVDPIEKQAMCDFFAEHSEVKSLLNLLTMHMGNDVMVAVKAEMVDHATDRDLILAINQVEAAFRKQFPSVRWLFFEPDIEI